MDEKQARELMMDCFKAAVRAAHPENCLEPFLPSPPDHGKIILLAGGKAAGSMMKVATDHYLPLVGKERLLGVAVGKPDGFAPMHHMEWIEAGHPVPDEGSVRGARRVLQLAQEAGENDLVVVLLSGGASALWCAPVEGVSLVQKQQITRDLLRCGTTINDINCVRKHLSGIKGGRLAKAVTPARLVTLAISDVVGDDPSVIASGPTSADSTSLAKARRILSSYGVAPSKAIEHALCDVNHETLFPKDPFFKDAEFHCVANGARALCVVQSKLKEQGFRVINLGDRVEGEARDVARHHALLVREKKGVKKPVALLSGGELTVTLWRGRENSSRSLHISRDGRIRSLPVPERGKGRWRVPQRKDDNEKLSRMLGFDVRSLASSKRRKVKIDYRHIGAYNFGGPNQEYMLALAMELGKTVGGLDGVYGLAADTDGCDGGTGKPSDPAGAMIFPSTLERAQAQKLNPATFLADNNSGTFFKKLDDLLVVKPTHTNVNDFRLVLIENA